MKNDVEGISYAEVINDDRNNVWHHLVQHRPFEESGTMVVVEGKGMRIKDAKGKEYLDATSGGLWTVNIGYGRESMAKAVHDQLFSKQGARHVTCRIGEIAHFEKLIVDCFGHAFPAVANVDRP